METSSLVRKLASVLCIALFAAAALCTAGCDDGKNGDQGNTGTSTPAAT